MNMTSGKWLGLMMIFLGLTFAFSLLLFPFWLIALFYFAGASYCCFQFLEFDTYDGPSETIKEPHLAGSDTSEVKYG